MMLLKLLSRCNFSLVTYRTYAKWLKRRAVRVLTAEESEQFHSSRRKSPAPEPNTVGKTPLVSGVDQTSAKFEPVHVGDPRFG